jgi:hypothetical protein
MRLLPLSRASAGGAADALSPTEKARRLLLVHLTQEQREDYLATRTFVVKARSGRRYRITTNTIYGIHQLARCSFLRRREVVRRQWCISSVDLIPTPDRLLATKLLIEANEGHFRHIANSRGARL